MRYLLLIAILSLPFGHTYAQYKKNAVLGEVAGKSFSFFGVEYQRYLTQKFHVGSGIGIGSKDYLVYGDGTAYARYNFSIPLYVAYAYGIKKHHAISELGISIRGVTGSGKHTNINESFPFLSLGYEYKSDRFIFKVPVYLIYVGRNEFFPSVMPWLGISFGVLF
jgi:hypothetical protein